MIEIQVSRPGHVPLTVADMQVGFIFRLIDADRADEWYFLNDSVEDTSTERWCIELSTGISRVLRKGEEVIVARSAKMVIEE